MRLCLVILLVFFSATSQSQTGAATKGSTPSSDRGANSAAGITLARHTNGESWTELSLAGSGLSPAIFNAVAIGKFEEPTYTRELVRVEWRRGDPIELNIVIPKGVTRPPVILYLYDYTADGSRFQSDGWCRRATQGGFAAVGFVSALSGQRFHSPRPMKQWFVSEMPEALVTSTHDVQLVLNYLTARGDLDLSKTGMIAQGSGGAVAILAASVDQRIAALDLINPWGDWPDWVKGSAQIPEEERAAYLTPEFLAKVAAIDPVNYLPKLTHTPLRIQQIMSDPVTPAAARDKIAANVPSLAEQVVRYASPAAHQEAWRSEGLSGWMRARLRPAALDAAKSDAAQGGGTAGQDDGPFGAGRF